MRNFLQDAGGCGIFAGVNVLNMTKESKREPYQMDADCVSVLSTDVLRLYYETVQKRMQDYHQQARDITERAYKVISIYVTLLTLLSAYLYMSWDCSWSTLALVFLLSGTVAAAILMLCIIYPRHYMPLGRRLSDLQPNEFTACFDEQETADDMQLRCILRDELNMMEQAIEWQGRRNRLRTRQFGWSLWAILAGVVLSVISFFIPYLFV